MATGWIILFSFLFVHRASGAVENVAFNKKANMSTALKGYRPDTAVDGNTNAVYQGGIIDTGTGHQSSWWRVDLGREVQDATVEIYFRTDYMLRRNGVQLYTSLSPFSDTDRGQLCYEVSGRPDGADIPDVVSVICSGLWRYLMVYTQRNNDGQGATLDFGEVKVLVCSTGTYGVDCNKSCSSRHCVTSSVYCYRYTGSCSGGCVAGYTASDCTEVLPPCASGAYGLNCTKSCSSRQCAVTSTSCDQTTGACPPDGGCKPGWMGADCTQVCSFGTYGGNCLKLCADRHCRTPSTSCDRETGQCPDGCQDGWTGDECIYACPDGTFGPKCFSCSTRHCQGESDCPEDGTCSGGCQDGWTLETCTQACPSETYGPGCNCTCGHCTGNGECDHVNGDCPKGCKAGWHSNTCKQACPNGKYGANCVDVCSHCNGTCEAVDGRCTLGCKQGYYGIHCNNKLSDVVSASTGHDIVVGVIGALIGLVMMFIIFGLLLCLMRNGRLKWMAGPGSEKVKRSTEMSDVSRVPVISQGMSDPPQSSSTRQYNTDYAVLNIQTKSDNKDYDVIRNRDHENERGMSVNN